MSILANNQFKKHVYFTYLVWYKCKAYEFNQ
jgi:hypothetical protein